MQVCPLVVALAWQRPPLRQVLTSAQASQSVTPTLFPVFNSCSWLLNTSLLMQPIGVKIFRIKSINSNNVKVIDVFFFFFFIMILIQEEVAPKSYNLSSPQWTLVS